MKSFNRHKLMLLPLIALLAACAQNSPESVGSWPVIQVLHQEARQGEAPTICWPTCSKKWSEKAERWRQKLTGVE
nr:hypothetical protein [Pseudomonas sp. C11]